MTAQPADRAPAKHGEPIEVGGQIVSPGKRKTFEIPIARLPTDTWMSMPLAVLNGKHAGPRLFLSAAVHGDELNGVEIIRRITDILDARTLTGTVIAVPIVNVFGFINESRYLPDRRDLNRSFPGSARGPLASRMAHLFMNEVVARCNYGIDLHTGSFHRTNLPQVRADLRDRETRRIAEAFGAPIMLHSRVRDGSLRQVATNAGTHVILYEGGEANRFDDAAIDAGAAGVMRVLSELGMWDGDGIEPASEPLASAKSQWVRARRGGILRLRARLGDTVEPGETVGEITDALGRSSTPVKARVAGLVIGHTRKPLVSQGDALIHVAEAPGLPDETLVEAAGVRDDLRD